MTRHWNAGFDHSSFSVTAFCLKHYDSRNCCFMPCTMYMYMYYYCIMNYEVYRNKYFQIMKTKKCPYLFEFEFLIYDWSVKICNIIQNNVMLWMAFTYSVYRVFHNEWYKSFWLFLGLWSIFRSETCGKMFLKLGLFGSCSLNEKIIYFIFTGFQYSQNTCNQFKYIKIVTYFCIKYHWCSSF